MILIGKHSGSRSLAQEGVGGANAADTRGLLWGSDTLLQTPFQACAEQVMWGVPGELSYRISSSLGGIDASGWRYSSPAARRPTSCRGRTGAQRRARAASERHSGSPAAPVCWSPL